MLCGPDTANARLLGSKQLEAYKSHAHSSGAGGAGTSIGVTLGSSLVAATGTGTGSSGGTETRGVNTAFNPVINL